MAQERRGAHGARRLAGRYGAACGVATALALCAALVGMTVLGGLGRGSVEIERLSPGEAAEPAAGEQDGASEKDAEGEKDEKGEAEKDAEADAAEGEAPSLVVVHVDGAVANPGVYTLPQGSRAADAVSAAGGLAEGADTTSVNLAAPVADGEKVHVPTVGEQAAPAAEGEDAEASPGPVNINTAGVEELDELPGVGEATARAIVEDREKNGPFASPEDLMRVSGIGEKKFERLAGLICV